MKSICKVLPLFISVLTVLFFSCEKDLDVVSENENYFKKLDVLGHIVKGDSIRQVNKDLDLFLIARFEQRDRFTSEDITSNAYGFTVNTGRVFQLNGDTYTNYIFNVNRDTPISDGFENYMLTVFNDGRYMQVLIYYPLIDSDDGLIADINSSTVTYINDDSLLTGIETPPCPSASAEIIAWEGECVPVNCGDVGNHSPGQACDNGEYVAYWQCSGGWVVTGCVYTGGGGSSTGSGSTNPNNPFPPTGNGGNPTNPVDPNNPNEEVPTVPFIPAWQEVIDCINMLSFDNPTTINELGTWLQNQSNDVVNTLDSMLDENSCDQESREDAAQEINGLMENPFIETTFDHFAVDELTNDCLLNVIRDEIINNLNANIINEIRIGLGQQANYILAFRQDDITTSSANAGTAMPSQLSVNNGLYPIIVNFDNNYLSGNPTKLSLAVTTIHEMVHGQLIYLYYEGELLQRYPNFTDLKSKFDVYVANRSEANRIALEDSMHIAMVNLIGSMSYALFKYAKDNRMENVTHQYCKDITKGTFSETPAMNVITPDVNLQNDYILKAQNEQNNTPDAKGKDC